MPELRNALKASVGYFSSPGPRPRNEDFGGAVLGSELPTPRRDIVAVIADGIGGAKGGRVAAEMAVRGFLDGFCDLPETMDVRRAAAQIVSALNSWLYSQGRHDAALAGMGCTLTALVLRGRTAHVLHIGDTRAYRLTGERLTCLTSDHVRKDAGGKSGSLYRALGTEPEVTLDYFTQPVALHDRFLLCSDGIHGNLSDLQITDILRGRSAPEGTAQVLVNSALRCGSTDNCSALIADIVRLPEGDTTDIHSDIAKLPLIAMPVDGDAVDGFLLKTLMSDGRYSRLFAAADEIEGADVVVKFPKPQAASESIYRATFVREAWASELINSPWVGRTIRLPPGRQSCLYSVMPLYQGELLQARLERRPQIGLEEARNIAIKLARAAVALHRVGVIHRDIKPDNVILESGGSLKLIDLGVVRIPGVEDAPSDEIPGTRAYMAPEMLEGEGGNPSTDLYALGVTIFHALTGEFPYSNADAVGPPRRGRPQELTLLRPDLPAWLQASLARAFAPDPADRFKDLSEFALEIESGPARAEFPSRRPLTLYERSPVLVWQCIAGLLALALAGVLVLK
jgi:serine/threonine protein phosphatase PrpC